MHRFGLVFLGLTTLLTMPVAAHECSITIGYNDEPIPPHIERNVPSAGPQGTAFVLVEQAAKQIGCQIVWQHLPTLRVLHAATIGDVDAALFYSWTSERASKLSYPMRSGQLDPDRRLATLNYVLYRQRGSAIEWDGTQLRPEGCAVGYNEGWSIVEFLQQHKISSHPGKGPGQLLKLLAKGRLCAYATLEEAGDTAIAAQTEQFEKLAPPLARKDYYLLVNPRFYHALQPQIEALLDRIGELRAEQDSAESK